MKFRYSGEVTDGIMIMYGLKWEAGAVHDVTDEQAIRKLSQNRFFECVDGGVEDQPKRRGRPPKAIQGE